MEKKQWCGLKGRAVELVYWRDVRSSAGVFGATTALLLALTQFSVVSVACYVCLAVLSVTVSFRVYKSVLQAVQKSDSGHPFRACLECDLGVSQATVETHLDVALARFNAVVRELRRLFLVEDLVDSLKFAVLMWLLTYIGAIFNGLTLLILGVLTLFTAPVVYEKYQTQIDHYLALARSNLNGVIAKVQAKIPGAKRKAE
ncbi:reticulon-1-A-like [Lethenteron reissneri]|uniref:reticulon-1-A-like n=1 Tax=Lethenteron reissneri TaxID=7753 RepID=UPI002AB6C0FF|nr:reticulon-1-A-like [Lethenteron reissneri]